MSNEIKILNFISIPIDKIIESEENPNEMSDSQFNELVRRITEVGFKEPISVIPFEDKYKLVAGHHRVKAAKFLGMVDIPAYIFSDWDDDKRKAELIRDNVIRGKMNPLKFSKLFDQLSVKYSKEIAQMMVGLSDEDSFKRYYKEVRAALPPDIRKKLDENKDKIKTIDDLSMVLNEIFTTHGDDLTFNFMVFSYGKSEHVYIKTNKEQWKMVQACVDTARTLKRDINDIIKIGIVEDLSAKEEVKNE